MLSSQSSLCSPVKVWLLSQAEVGDLLVHIGSRVDCNILSQVVTLQVFLMRVWVHLLCPSTLRAPLSVLIPFFFLDLSVKHFNKPTAFSTHADIKDAVKNNSEYTRREASGECNKMTGYLLCEITNEQSWWTFLKAPRYESTLIFKVRKWSSEQT